MGDFGGGGMMLAFGMVSALLRARITGYGQVVDCAMVDGAALLMSMVWSFRAAGAWSNERGTNLLDTGAPFYNTYETKDGKFVALGAIEPHFFEELCEKAGIGADLGGQMDKSKWPRGKLVMAEIMRQRTSAEWCDILEGSDACFSPILDLDEAPLHEHNLARHTFVEASGVMQPAPAPHFSSTPAKKPEMPSGDLATESVLVELGLPRATLERLRMQGIIM